MLPGKTKRDARSLDHATLEETRRLAMSGVLAGEFVGFEVLHPQVIWAPVRMSVEQRAAELSAWAERLRQIEREAPIEVGAY